MPPPTLATSYTDDPPVGPMSNTSHQPTTATRVTDPDSDPSRATSYHVTKTSPPCQTKCRPHTQPPPQTAAHRAPDMSDRNGGRPASRVEPGSPSRSSQRGASPPPRTWRARPTGVLVIDCFLAQTLHGLRRMGATGDRGQRWLGVAVVDVRARALLPSRLYHHSGTHCSSWQLDAIPQPAIVVHGGVCGTCKPTVI